jgi:NADPH:quinone reductase-like Zn-dependent oxidoreductase
MKVIEIRYGFGVDSLRLMERPDPVPRPGQVVLKMQAFSINYRDLLVVNGVGRWKPSVGRIPLSDGVGIVAAVGNGISRVKVGHRVGRIFYPNWLEGRVAAHKMGQAWVVRLLTAYSPNTSSLTRPAWCTCRHI